jgi:hypothetical protein
MHLQEKESEQLHEQEAKQLQQVNSFDVWLQLSVTATLLESPSTSNICVVLSVRL